MSSLMTTEEAAARLGLAAKTLEAWRFQGKGPRFCKLGRAVRYRKLDVERFLERSVRCSTADNGGSREAV